MINYTNKSSFNDRPRFVLIDNAEHLNISSVNALLKVIEEPNDNLFFILIHNNKKSLIKTLKSRCLLFKINLTFDESISITNQLLNNNLFLRDFFIIYNIKCHHMHKESHIFHNTFSNIASTNYKQ